jgi:hypothetical protein
MGRTVQFRTYTPGERRRLEELAAWDEYAEQLRLFVDAELGEIIPPLDEA